MLKSLKEIIKKEIELIEVEYWNVDRVRKVELHGLWKELEIKLAGEI